MERKRIVLCENGKQSLSLDYSVTFHNPDENIFPIKTVDIYTEKMHRHYLLITSQVILRERIEQTFGIAHTTYEADKRLYEKAKHVAEDIAKREKTTNLEDRTRHYQSLQRGGK